MKCEVCKGEHFTLVLVGIDSVWECNNCHRQVPAFTFKEMATTVINKIFRLTPGAIKTTPNWTVYLESVEGESELPPEALDTHIKVSGRYPEIGKPVYTHGGVPYGKVVRIDKKIDNDVSKS